MWGCYLGKKLNAEEKLNMQYNLIINFKTPKNKLLYSGVSFYNKNLIDQIMITGKKIELIFQRTRIKFDEDLIKSPRSNLRYQLHRALCYYLAINGEIPSVLDITLKSENQSLNLETSLITEDWANCRCDTLFESSDLNCIFQDQEYSKPIYIALTYWLKSELSLFENDRFRALWSGFNALYKEIHPKERPKNNECEQLKYFKNEFMKQRHFEKSTDYLEGFVKEEFWNTLEWFNFIRSKSLRYLFDIKKDNLIDFLDHHPDKKLLLIFTHHLSGIEKGNENILAQMTARKQYIAQCSTDYFSQLKFLLANYIYFMRNNYFHASKAYPLFNFGDNGSENEKIICNILKLSVCETIKSLNTEH